MNELHISEIIQKITKKYNLQYGLNKIEARQAWHTVMGKTISKHTDSVELKDGTLYVELSSAALRQELYYGKEKIIHLINEEMRSKAVSEVVLK